MDSYSSPSTKPLFRGTQITWYILGFIEVLLAFRFAMKLLGANTGAAFTDIIYTVSHPFVYPFISVFKTSRVSGSIFEWTTLLAMFVYWVIAIGIIKIFLMSKTVSTPEAAVKLENQE
ncbi:MAG: YggT family protein [Patescibacteria group bacterium]